MRIAQCDYDKPNRCPGWSGSAWTYNKRDWCEDRVPEGRKRWGDGSIFDKRLWYLRVNRTTCCGTYVLPHALIWLNWRTWRHGFGFSLLVSRLWMMWFRVRSLFAPAARSEEGNQA